MVRHADRNPLRHAQGVVLALAVAVALPIAAAEDEARPQIRHVAPDVIPYYPGAISADPVALPEIVLPTPDHPLGNCERTLPRARFALCLQRTLELSRRSLEATVIAAQAKTASRTDLPNGHRERWGKLIAEVHQRWQDARNIECAQLRPLERGPKADVFLERSVCMLAANAGRIAELKQRYDLP